MGFETYAKRKQYGLRPRVWFTLHAAMGQTLPCIVTKVDALENSIYHLWERAQVIVLLSRTRFAKQIFFVGDPRRTAETLLNVLKTFTQFTKYICELLNNLIEANESTSSANLAHPLPPFSLQDHPFRPIDVEIPSDNTGVCYILISCRNKAVTYIGQMQNLLERLDQHNSRYGSIQTAPVELQPWGLLAYVVGFDTDKRMRLAFEHQWKNVRENERLRQRRNLTPGEIAALAEKVIAMRKVHDKSESLRLVYAANVNLA